MGWLPYGQKIKERGTKVKDISKPNVKIQVDSVSPRAIGKLAEDNFRGGFYCCEALMAAIRDGFALDVPDEVIAMSSGMGVGVGHSGCLCGAVNGGVMALGMLFGRTERKGPQDPRSQKVMQLTSELLNWFKDNNGKHSSCCRVLTREFDMAKGEHKEQCVRFTGMCAEKTAEIICRETGVGNLDAEAVPQSERVEVSA